jgi:hypothetical protein
MTWSRVLLEKLVVAQLVKKLHTFAELRALLLCPEQATTGSYSEPNFFRIHFNIILPCAHRRYRLVTENSSMLYYFRHLYSTE